MLDAVLDRITDRSEYITAISALDSTKKITESDINALRPIYEKHVPGANDDPEYCTACMAVDMLSGRSRENINEFKLLGLSDSTLDAFFSIQDMVNKGTAAEKEEVQKMVAILEDESVSEFAKLIVARITLNFCACSRDFMDTRPEIDTLVHFLTGIEKEKMEKYEAVTKEVRFKCLK